MSSPGPLGVVSPETGPLGPPAVLFSYSDVQAARDYLQKRGDGRRSLTAMALAAHTAK